MSLIRRAARPLLAAPFVFEGVQVALHPEREIDVAPGAFAKVDEKLSSSPVPGVLDTRTIIRTAGVVAAGAGICYATNRAPRASAALLLVTTSVGIANRKKIWELRGHERNEEIKAILTDAGLLGGVLLAVADTDGNPSVGYRMSKLVERGQKAAEKKRRALDKSSSSLSKRGQKKADKLARRAQKKADGWSKAAKGTLDSVTSTVHDQFA